MPRRSRATEAQVQAALNDIVGNGITIAQAAVKHGVSEYTLKYRKRMLNAETKAEHIEAAVKEAFKDVDLSRVAPNVDLRKHEIAQMFVAGVPMSVIAKKTGCKWETVKRWSLEDIEFQRVCNDLRLAAHDAAISRVKGLAQEYIDHQSAAAKLVRMLLDQATARMEEGPPVDGTTEVLVSWYKATDQMIARALEAARVLNGSPIPGMGGYPKVVKQEVTAEVDLGSASIGEAIARASTSGWVQDLTSDEKH